MIFLIGLIAVFVLGIVLKLLRVSASIIWKLLMNAIAGLILLFIVNAVGGNFGIHIEINEVSAVLAGIFGIPYVILVLISQSL